ncbi:Gfo/Idh/MocA family oxidoreductase [Bremerella sp. JC817]|uniref:Gfo/Idh/MocA family protein n=1 Tax=Bremerella sp. JC817 TaxID=3231756 RepID=UPI00345B0577
MIKVGIVGVGFMSWIHYLAYQKVRGMKVTSFCSRDPKKQKGDWRGIKGNFGPAGEQIDVSKMAVYATLEEMLADDSIDMVDICLPPALHEEATIKALKAGKHVLVEKPIALDPAAAKRMQKAADKCGKLMLTAHVLPFFTEFNFALEAARSGKFGKVLGGHFKRLISDPTWIPDFYDLEKVGGPLLDLHIHDAHFIRLMFGMPTSVTSVGRMRGDCVEYCTTQFGFADSSYVVTATSGVLHQPGRSFTHGFEIHFEEATLLMDFAVIDDAPVVAMPLTVLPKKGKSKQPKLKGGDPVDSFAAELKEVEQSILSGTPSSILGGDVAVDALVLCQKQADSIAKGKTVRV